MKADENSWEETGGSLGAAALKNKHRDQQVKSTNYKIFKTNSKNSLEKILEKIKQNSGPILIQIQVSKSTEKSSRVDIDPPDIKSRFIKAIN